MPYTIHNSCCTYAAEKFGLNSDRYSKNLKIPHLLVKMTDAPFELKSLQLVNPKLDMGDR